jgi:hypothetical protein
MTTLQKISEVPADETGAMMLRVDYLVGDQDRTIYLLPDDITGLTAGEILALAQALALATAVEAVADYERTDILENPAKAARAWYLAHPNAAQLFELSIDDLDAAIQNRTAGGETLLLKTLAIAVRVLAKREGLT